MSLDRLLALLAGTAEAEAEALLAAARGRAAELDRDSEARVRRRRETELARLAETRRRAVARDTAAAEHEHRNTLLQERARILERVFGQAASRLATMGVARYQTGLEQLVASTLTYLEGMPVVLQCRPDAEPAIRDLCSSVPEVRVQGSGDAAAGIRAASADGAIVVDNTLPALMTRGRAELSVALAARLEEAPP